MGLNFCRKELNDIKDRINTLEGNLDTITNRIEELSVINDELSGIKEDVQDNKDNMMSKYQELKEEISKSSKKSETVYTRWGRTTCPGINSETVYSGYAAGSHWTHVGAAASMLCLPTDPDWEGGNYSDAHNVHTGLLYGTEYHDGQDRTDTLFGEDHYQQDVPCVLCNVKGRSSTIMIPGKTRCHAGWTFEYSGYLMSGHYAHTAATDYYCVDLSPEEVPNSSEDKNGRLLYFVEARCGSLLCPPYVEGREFRCVVCTK